jgi:MarR family transcriptional regulator for hemolysin
LNYNSNNIGYLLNNAARAIKWQLNRRLEEHNLTSAQWAVLKDLHMNEIFNSNLSTTPASIAERLNMDRPTMSGIVNRLLKSQWIETTQNPEDKRSQILRLTDKSREIISVLEGLSDDIVSLALKDFKEEEARVLTKLLQKIMSNLSS